MSSLCPVNVVPRTAATPMVFSSTWGADVVWADRVLAGLERHDPWLDVEIAAELLPHDMHVPAKPQVRICCRFPHSLPPLAPVPLQRKTAEHDRLRQALRTRPGRLAWCVEE